MSKSAQTSGEPAAPFDGKAFVSTLSGSPGVYRMFDAAGEPLYSVPGPSPSKGSA